MKIPFWDKVSEGWKQILAALAVIQAVHFAIATPLGIYDGWQLNRKFEAETWVPRVLAARSDILATLYTNNVVYFGGYKEECLENLEEHGRFLSDLKFEKDNCNSMETLQEIIDLYIDIYKVPQKEREILIDDLRTTGELPL